MVFALRNIVKFWFSIVTAEIICQLEIGSFVETKIIIVRKIKQPKSILEQAPEAIILVSRGMKMGRYDSFTMHEEVRSAFKILTEKPIRNRPLGKLRLNGSTI